MSVTAQHAPLKGALSAPRFDLSAKAGRSAFNRHVSTLAREAYGLTPTLEELALMRQWIRDEGDVEDRDRYFYPVTPAYAVFATVGWRVIAESEGLVTWRAMRDAIQAVVPYHL